MSVAASVAAAATWPWLAPGSSPGSQLKRKEKSAAQPIHVAMHSPQVIPSTYSKGGASTFLH